MRLCINQLSKQIMSHVKMIVMMRSSLAATNIDKIGLCMANLEVHFHYHIYHID